MKEEGEQFLRKPQNHPAAIKVQTHTPEVMSLDLLNATIFFLNVFRIKLW